jgi:peptidoglycan/LPS O-acetylase OafA/YrhL
VIYFLHSHFGLPPVALLTLVLVGMAVLAWLVHRLIERPLAPRLKRALSQSVQMPGRGGAKPAADSGPAIVAEPATDNDAAANDPHGQSMPVPSPAPI